MTDQIQQIITKHSPQNPYIDKWNNHLIENLPPNIKSKIVFSDLRYPLFNDGLSITDIRQGRLGNCYLLSALASLVRFPEKIHRLFYTEGIKYGIIGVWFFLEGSWNLTIIDTLIPCINNKPAFSHCGSSKESWVMFIEKAWAKLNNNYYNTNGGDTNDILQFLLGSLSYDLDLSNENLIKQYLNGNLWNNLCKEFNSGKIITTGSLKKLTSNDDIDGMINPLSINSNDGGLLDNHAYSIIDIKEFANFKLLKLYNPWGKFEWNGEWSDYDTNNWTDNIRKKLNHYNVEDGCFWIKWEDFFSNFGYFFVSYLPHNNKIVLKNEWNKSNCGGLNENWIYNPKYSINFKTDDKTNLIINISQKDTRRLGKENWLYIILDVIQNSDNELKNNRSDNNILKTFILNKRTRTIDINIDPTLGNIWIVPSLWEEGRIGNYYILLTSTDIFEVNETVHDSNPNILLKEDNKNCAICNKFVNLFHDKFTFKQVKWHPECYKCQNCSIDLQENLYDIGEINNNYGGFCKECYINQFSDKCSYCMDNILPYSSYYKIRNQKVHIDCSLAYIKSISDPCDFCKEPICKIPDQFSGKYYIINNKKIHFECYQLYLDSISKKCIVCHQNILGHYYKSSYGEFHIECYSGYLEMISPECVLCKKKIIKQRYYQLRNNKCVHIDCYNNR